MKKLNSLPYKEILHYVMQSKRLREKFDQHISEQEMSWLEEKLNLFWKYGRSADWSIGAYNQNYFKVKDASAFLYSVEDSMAAFGYSLKLYNMAEQCKKLRDTNLFAHQVEKLCNLYYEEELHPIVKQIEDCSYDIHCMNETERILDYVEIFAEKDLCDIYINSRNQLVRLDYVSA